MSTMVLTNAPLADQTSRSKLFLPPSCTLHAELHPTSRCLKTGRREMLLLATRKFGAEASKCQRNNERRTNRWRTKRKPLVNVQTVHRTTGYGCTRSCPYTVCPSFIFLLERKVTLMRARQSSMNQIMLFSEQWS
jgi:hypothetical protein